MAFTLLINCMIMENKTIWAYVVKSLRLVKMALTNYCEALPRAEKNSIDNRKIKEMGNKTPKYTKATANRNK